MNEQRIRSNLKKLLILFFAICLLIGGIAQYLFRSVSYLYMESVQGRLEERALQYKKSFLFKTNSDLQTLRAMACMLEDTIESSASAKAAGNRLSYLWDASQTAGFVRLCYFNPYGEGMRLSSQKEVIALQTEEEAPEMQSIIQQALQGDTLCSEAFYNSNLGYNTIGYATPVYTNDEISGVLACSVSTESYADILSSINSVSDVGAVAVLSNDGDVLASTRTHQAQGFYQIDGSDYLNNELRDKFMQALSVDEIQFFEFDFNGITAYACIMPMEVCSDKIIIVDTDKGVSDAVLGVVNYAHLIAILFAVSAILFVLAVLYISRRHDAQLSKIAYHDRLTGAYNRYKFFQLLDQRRKQPTEYAVAVINIRKFKYINELFGSDRSNQLLKDVCTVLKRHMEQGEFFCRDTADTFAVCLNTSDRATIRKRLEIMFAELKESGRSVHHSCPISCYGGCATTEDCADKNNNEELMSHVMLALNYANQSQQAAIFFYDTKIHEKEMLQNYIEKRMEFALEHGEFQMFLQPKIDLKKKCLCGAEALVRWIVDGKQTIFPDQFIPVFEHNGFCVQLDYYMVEQACKQIRIWMDAGLPPVPISVNQTKLLLYEDDYVERICATTQRYGVPCHYITLEILEGLALENPEKVSDCIDRLHHHGFQISMDDFGTGYTSLTTLSHLKIDELKLDRSFLIQADRNAENNRRKILEVVIEVAKRLHITTVAEGIETGDHVKLMQEMGCDYGQGYYYSRAISATEFTNIFLYANGSASAEQNNL